MNKTRVNAFCFIILMATILMFAVVAWAAPVPDTGQTKCYDVAGNVITCPSPGQALYGQDANYSINPMSFTKLDGKRQCAIGFGYVVGYGKGQCYRPGLGDEK